MHETKTPAPARGPPRGAGLDGLRPSRPRRNLIHHGGSAVLTGGDPPRPPSSQQSEGVPFQPSTVRFPMRTMVTFSGEATGRQGVIVAAQAPVTSRGRVEATERLGGLLKFYSRAA